MSGNVIGEQRKSVDDVQRLAEQHGLQTDPIDLDGLLRLVNIRLVQEDMDPDVSGFLERRSSGWVIGVNRKHHPRRQRFTIAHELGHFFRHRGQENTFRDTAFWRGTKSDPVEWEANDFAGELLMPRDKFHQLVSSGMRSLDRLAEEFRVSRKAVEVRASILGYKVRESSSDE